MTTQQDQAAQNAIAGLTALLRLEQEARSAPATDDLGFIIANRTYTVLPYDLAVFWMRGPLGRPRAMVLSGTPDLAPGSPFTLWLKKALARASRHAKAGEVHPLGVKDIPKKERKDWSEWFGPESLWCPFLTPKGKLFGGVWLIRKIPWSPNEVEVARHLSGSYAHAWLALTGGKVALEKRRLAARLATISLLALTISAMFLPVQQSVLAPAAVAPVEPVVVTAPQNGVMREILVSPNAPVRAGQLLFRLDEREAKNRLEVARQAMRVIEAELLKTRQEAFSDRQAKSRIALLQAQIEEQKEEVRFATSLLAQLETRAPSAGIALFDDPLDWTGRPVSLGEQVLSLADPDRVEIRIDLPMSELIDLPDRALVRLFLNSDPLNPIAATVAQVGYLPRQTAEGVMAYQVKARLTSGTEAPRIGLRGTAKIHGHQVPLYMYLFRRPLSALRQMIGF